MPSGKCVFEQIRNAQIQIISSLSRIFILLDTFTILLGDSEGWSDLLPTREKTCHYENTPIQIYQNFTTKT